MERQTIFTAPRAVLPHKPLTSKEVAIIEALRDFWLLTPEQVMRLFWRGNALTTAYDVLKRLTEREYASRVYVPKTEEEIRGRYRYAYRLGSQSLRLLRELERPAPKRLNLSRVPIQQLPHTLATNDVLIAATRLGRCQEHAKLTRFLHEKVLHQHPHRVKLPNGTTRGFELDGVLCFEVIEHGQAFEQILLLETDMGNKQDYWKRKLTSLIAYARTRYAQEYHSDSFNYVVYSPTSATHVRNLVHWTEDVLTSMQLQQWSEFFSFTNVPAATTQPADFFFGKHWHRPFSDGLTSPMEVVHG